MTVLAKQGWGLGLGLLRELIDGTWPSETRCTYVLVRYVSQNSSICVPNMASHYCQHLHYPFNASVLVLYLYKCHIKL